MANIMICILKVMHYFWMMSSKTSKKKLRIYQMNIYKIYQINPAKLLSAPGLTWQASLKKTEVKLELLTDINNLLMVEKGIEGGNVMQFIIMKKLVINIWKIMIKIKNCHIFNTGM